VSAAGLFVAGATMGEFPGQLSAGGQDAFVAKLVDSAAPTPTTIGLSTSANPSVFGQSVTITATVAGVGGSGTPTGTIQFMMDGNDFGSPVALVNGAASFTSAGLSTGPHSITATYAGDGSFAASTATALSQVVNRAATASGASVSAPTPLFGVDGVTIGAVISVVAPGSGNPTGTVNFYDGLNPIGSAVLAGGAASLALGNATLTAGLHTIRAVYTGDGNFLGSDSAVTVNVLAPSTIQGLVYLDFNNDGQVDFGERAIANVTITLAGTDDLGHAVSQTALTDANGVFAFINLRPSNAAGYTLTETQPAGLLDGRDTLGAVNGVPIGSVANDVFSGIVLAQGGSFAENYNFGERPATDGAVAAGETATIGFWNNRNGQNLITALNGGASATQVGHWLAATFPNMYAALGGMTNSQVAAYYKTLFARTASTAPAGPPKVDAQIMATALAVYVTNQSLAGTTAAGYGFLVSATGLGAQTFDVGCNGAAFGVANHTSLSVMDLLLAVNARARNGLLFDMNGDGYIDNSEASYRTMANDVFAAINEAGDI
jgi:Bacterial Ig-like domain (group 3)/SdrD B-like domain